MTLASLFLMMSSVLRVEFRRCYVLFRM